MEAFKIKIDCLIISDIHLGDSTARCREVLEVLRKYDYDKLILNGDIVDGLRLERWTPEHWGVFSKLKRLSKKCEVVWIHGNHDASNYILSRLLGLRVRNRYVWKYGRKKFLAIHGHQYDRYLNNNYIASQIAYIFYSFIKNIDYNGILANLIRNRSAVWERGSLEVAKGALRLGRLLMADYVFCGHTHKIHSEEGRGIKYFNTGSWVEKPSAYITITGDQVELHKID